MPLLYTIVPVCLAVLGAVFATRKNPGATFTSGVWASWRFCCSMN